MKKKLWVVSVLSLILVSCARSPNPQFYVLQPLPYTEKGASRHHMRIGINDVNLPAYLSKSSIVVHTAPHEVVLKDFHQWAGALKDNVQRVIMTNLETLIPGAAIASFPWDSHFQPDYQLQINILQFDIYQSGMSVLRVNYLVYSQNQLYKRGVLYYSTKVPVVNVATLVASMNTNLTRFTRDLVKVLLR